MSWEPASPPLSAPRTLLQVGLYPVQAPDNEHCTLDPPDSDGRCPIARIWTRLDCKRATSRRGCVAHWLAALLSAPPSATQPLATPRHASPRLASPRLATPRHASPRLVTPRHASPRLILSQCNLAGHSPSGRRLASQPFAHLLVALWQCRKGRGGRTSRSGTERLRADESGSRDERNWEDRCPGAFLCSLSARVHPSLAPFATQSARRWVCYSLVHTATCTAT